MTPKPPLVRLSPEAERRFRGFFTFSWPHEMRARLAAAGAKPIAVTRESGRVEPFVPAPDAAFWRDP